MITKLYNGNPNPREIQRIVNILSQGGIAVLPTDTLYAFVCSMQHKKSVETIAHLKGFSLKQARYSMLCQSLSQLSDFVRPMDKDTYQLLRRCLPGPYTFIMDANNNVPRNFQNANKTIGMRVPANDIFNAIVEAVGCPLIGTSVRKLDETLEKEYLTDPDLIHELYGDQVDIVVDGGIGEDLPSTVIDCSNGNIELLRAGKGEIPEELL